MTTCVDIQPYLSSGKTLFLVAFRVYPFLSTTRTHQNIGDSGMLRENFVSSVYHLPSISVNSIVLDQGAILTQCGDLANKANFVKSSFTKVSVL